ncbi:1,2-phenylacetyl-CoA epoxidase subunit PaaC [Candidimonas nitroreducens]|uniref:Phenylacetate-CoA oxygenase subunit PaaI n=1 Tax=Candidimonas nitroreducens TaxID=683354 RepID=A0A225MXH3_9BURK|nr:1,2-phenylacetyl-CoA epoxidase subunit PaaC [Candidimonas nitroreducens]OWT65772.1 phenylacetate-CoA oxygenase subunit PaaI [Candidimonas nitroreducens]
MDSSLFQYALRMGDTTLILSQRLSQWCGHGPALEEDLALTNLSLDLLGQARLWLTLAGEVEGAGRDEDRLAYLRDAPEYRNYLLAERPNGHYGDTIARQFLFDVWHYFLLQGLASSADERVAAIAAKSLKEVTYHARRSADLVVRLGDGTELSHGRMQAALEEIWFYVGELFVDDDVVADLAGRGIAVSHEALWPAWHEHVAAVLQEATLRLPDAADARHPAYQGGPSGRHTEALGYVLAEMQHLQRTYPGASW